MPSYLNVEFTSHENASASIVIMDKGLNATAGHSDDVAHVKEVAEHASFNGKKGQSYLHVHHDADKVKAILAIGSGDGMTTTLEAELLGAALYKALRSHKIDTANISCGDADAELTAAMLYGAMSQAYEFNNYFTKKDEPSQIQLGVSAHSDALPALYDDKMAMLKGVFLARDLITEPANILYPAEFASRCEALSSLGLEVEVLDEAAMTKMGMGALLGVGQGSRRESKMVIMKWQGGGDEAPLAYVGKGVCFDTGGISLKPAKGMEDMKWDMGGAAAVTGAMCAIASRKVARNVVGIIGLVENMPDGNAQRPGDVVTSMSGQTIEVINTDAEGRLVLADCLTFCQNQFKPQMIVDLATLTGAIIVALGKDYAGLFSNDKSLSDKIIASGEATADQCWSMPMGDNYHDMLKSHIADMKNIGGPWGGSITAACFLEKFIDEGTPWAHIDMAGKAWADKAGHAHPSGGTGFGVRLLNDLADNWDSK